MTHAQKPKAYIFCPSRSRARLLSLSRWHNSCIFCNVSMSSRFNTTAIRVAWKIQLLWNHATTFLCRISCSPSHKWFCFFKISPLLAYHIIQRRSTMRESRFSSCQSKNVLWWVEWSRLVKNGDFFLFTLRRWIVHVFCARMFLLCLIPFLTYMKYFRRMIWFKPFCYIFYGIWYKISKLYYVWSYLYQYDQPDSNQTSFLFLCYVLLNSIIHLSFCQNVNNPDQTDVILNN